MEVILSLFVRSVGFLFVILLMWCLCARVLSDFLSFFCTECMFVEVVDTQGNAVSMVNSNYEGFGSGIIPQGCGFSLQNRGANFSLVPGHHNVLEPRKRPYHTIIPALVVHSDTHELFCTFTNMGGFAQPQAHLQLLVNMLDFGLDPQSAIDAPRFCIVDGSGNGEVALEEGINVTVAEKLVEMGHRIKRSDDGSLLVTGQSRAVFGRAQIIVRDRVSGVLCAGSDGRADGCAMGF
jgi:gamma-glutamyltranspeptidase/glutathione hydrolase